MTVVFLVLFLAGCTITSPTPPPTPPTLTLAGHNFAIEIADTPSARQAGLMHREYLCDDCGMLFIFSAPQPVSFWMKDTLIPLDILYFDADKKLVEILPDTPPCEVADCPSYPSSSDAIQFVLELPAGTAEKIGATINDVFSTDF